MSPAFAWPFATAPKSCAVFAAGKAVVESNVSAATVPASIATVTTQVLLSSIPEAEEA